tara:strand:- start:299 stop:2692 length:2394 start_codon:yes stop_codon:yes gene_type:complete
MVFSNNLLMGAAGQATGYEIDQSIRFNDNDSAHLARDGFGQSPTSSTVCTISVWVKRGNNFGSNSVIIYGGDPSGSTAESLRFGTGNQLQFSQASSDYDLKTTQLFRDVGAWYHIVAVLNTGAAESSRAALYVNGSQVTAFATENYPGSSYSTNFTANSSSVEHVIGSNASGGGASQFFDGYIAEFNFIDGQALTPASFGETNADGVWVPKAYSGSYGNNGFFIDGRDSSDLGDDESGNGNDLTSSGLTTADQMGDTPTNNFWTLNPTDRHASNVTILDGNLRADCTSSAEGSVFAPMLPETGKWAWKITATLNMGSGAEYPVLGIVPSNNADLRSPMRSGGTGEGYGADGRFFSASAGSNSSYGAAWADGDVIEVGWDADNGALSFWHEGSAQGVAVTGLTGRWKPAQDHYSTAGGDTLSDFGQSGYTPTDSSYKTLCTANLPTPTVADGSKYFQTTLYTGNGTAIGSGGLEVNQSGNSTFQPDFAWIKNRTSAGNEHDLYDAVRGVTKVLFSSTTQAEATVSEGLTSFDTDGFTVGNRGEVNTSGNSMVGWQWLANGSGSGNTDGSINTTATSVNTTAGFSIIEWSGTGANGTIGHGLGIQPSLYIVKNTATTNSWMVGSTLYPNTKFLNLNSSDALDTAAAVWNSAYPTSSVINLGSNVASNGSGTNNMICYAFAEIPNYSSIGSYTGNGSTDGPFVYTGFKPAFIIFKVTSNAPTGWVMLDNQRDTYNAVNHVLQPNENSAESSGSDNWDILSNGFKVRTTWGAVNGSGYTVTYIAFAEHPFGGDGVAPATAR